jgi:hypothetical protein
VEMSASEGGVDKPDNGPWPDPNPASALVV